MNCYCGKDIGIEDEDYHTVTHIDNQYGSYIKLESPENVCDECFEESHEEVCGICEELGGVDMFYENAVHENPLTYYRKEYEGDGEHQINGIYHEGTLVLKGYGDESAVCDSCATKARKIIELME